jgi:hypothetical protein
MGINWKVIRKFAVGLLAVTVAVFTIGLFKDRNTHRIDRSHSSSRLPPCKTSNNQRKLQDPNISWLDIFKFVPNNLRDCSKLFNGDATLTDDFMWKFEAYENELAAHGFKKVEGYTAMFPFNYKSYMTIAQAPFLKTVCETGFNAGHSTFGWLTTNPGVHVYSFDIGKHDYSRPMATYLQKLYPDRLNVTWGDSTVTLPKFQQDHPHVKCDLIIIDGGHTQDVCESDFYNFMYMANFDNILILDDYPTPQFINALGDVWEHGKRKGEISEFFSCSYHNSTQNLAHGFAVGKFLV